MSVTKEFEDKIRQATDDLASAAASIFRVQQMFNTWGAQETVEDLQIVFEGLIAVTTAVALAGQKTVFEITGKNDKTAS